MLVLIGTNGRTGAAIYAEAKRRGMRIRPVVRDDRDIERIKKLVDVRELCYADPNHLDALRPVMEGATTVISCIDPRTTGPGATLYERPASANIATAAVEAGVAQILHLSVFGAYRWSYAPLNQQAFELEVGLRDQPCPWAVLRVSCYFDELIEGHVRPPDGGKPHPIPKGGRWSPTSRRDAAKMALDYLDRMVPGRLLNIGGPKPYFARDLDAMLRPLAQRGNGRLTRAPSLPPGDVSVQPDSTRSVVGYVPVDTLEAALEAGDDGEPPRRDTVYPTGEPAPHPADMGAQARVLEKASADLRRALHRALVDDLPRLGLPKEGVRLDFGRASPGARWVKAHAGELPEMKGVRVLDARGELLFTGEVELLRDRLAEELRVWWKGDQIPDAVWESLDMGVRRRLTKDSHFAVDPRVRAFAQGRAEG